MLANFWLLPLRLTTLVPEKLSVVLGSVVPVSRFKVPALIEVLPL